MKNSYNSAFPVPSFIMMSSCALDISDQSIKYGVLSETKNGLALDHYDQEVIPENVIVSGQIKNDSVLIEVLKKLKIKENLNFIRVALPEEQMYLFTLSLPKIEHKDIYNAIYLQLEEHAPIKAVEAIFAYNIISENVNNIFVEVSAVAISTVNSYLYVFEKASLVPLSLELEAQAIARSVVAYEDQSTCMIVDFGRARTGVSIASGGKVFFTTTVDFGGAELTKRIAEAFNISFEKAEDLKKSYGINSHNPDTKIFDAMLSGLALLKDELNKHCTFWQTHNISGASHDPISQIILCGGDANLQGLTSYLESQLKIKVISANAWTNVSDFNSIVPKMSFEQSLSYTTVIGLALGDHDKNHSRIINVLAQENKNKIKISYWMRFFSVSLSYLGLLFLFASVLLLPSYISSALKEKELEVSLESFNKAHKELDLNSMSNVVSDINTKLVVLSVENKRSEIVESIFKDILNKKTSDIRISSISYNQKDEDSASVQLSGVASNRASLSNFKESLISNSYFKNVDIPISNFLEKKDLKFNFLIDIK